MVPGAGPENIIGVVVFVEGEEVVKDNRGVAVHLALPRSLALQVSKRKGVVEVMKKARRGLSLDRNIRNLRICGSFGLMLRSPRASVFFFLYPPLFFLSSWNEEECLSYPALRWRCTPAILTRPAEDLWALSLSSSYGERTILR